MGDGFKNNRNYMQILQVQISPDQLLSLTLNSLEESAALRSGGKQFQRRLPRKTTLRELIFAVFADLAQNRKI